MELAFNQGMDIINMSLGGGSAWRNNPLAILAEKLHDLGMTTIAAAGNDGDQVRKWPCLLVLQSVDGINSF